MHHSFLPVLAAAVALKKGAGGDLGLLKERDLERICVVSLGPKKESSESFQMVSEPLWLLRARCCLSHTCPHPLCQCCGQCLCWAVLVSPSLPWARCQGGGHTQLKFPLEEDSSTHGDFLCSWEWRFSRGRASPQLLHWPSRRCGANDSDEDEGLISMGRGGKREKRERVFHCKKIDTTSPRQSRSAASPSARRHVHRA